tara:strand:+ start:24972 stop:25073 length:102 start_codon:yes stop_codon:yes gene_type:complete
MFTEKRPPNAKPTKYRWAEFNILFEKNYSKNGI